jgi:poly(A) polymerase/tRNA nucleotidyltransferase (CCA-adding enzyme)
MAESQTLIKKEEIPEVIITAVSVLEKAGFEAYLVGGCVRDLILGRKPKDWDITTNATPEQIQALYSKTVYENTFGTVAIVYEEQTEEALRVIEITPYRIEAEYNDNRHPESVHFSLNLQDDLKRRDFTVNALAYSPSKGQLVDDFGGLKDIKDKIIRTVGEPKERFSEDALRLLRAVRFSTQLGFTISSETMQGVAECASLLKNISWERKRDEFTKIIESNEPVIGIGFLERLGLLEFVIPELREGIGCEQGGEHIYDVFEHLLQACGHAAGKNWPFAIRIAALFHDIGKPRTKRPGIKKPTFYGHEVVGARMTAKIMERMRYPKDFSELVVKLVRYHMFFSDTETITLSAVRRTIVNIGRDHIWELMQIRECDRVGMKKKEAPYRLRKYHAMIEEALRAPTSVSMLKINGEVLIKELGIQPGRRMGWILHALLEEALEEPDKNNSDYLKSQALELNKLSDAELKEKGEAGKAAKQETEEEELAKIRGKHGVK